MKSFKSVTVLTHLINHQDKDLYSYTIHNICYSDPQKYHHDFSEQYLVSTNIFSNAFTRNTTYSYHYIIATHETSSGIRLNDENDSNILVRTSNKSR